MIDSKTINAAVQKIFSDIRFTDEPKGLYDPLRYMIEIGGKRLRPTLCVMSYAAFSDEFGEHIFGPAAALEVFHSFTLMHDDIMDRSPLRRNMPTVWKKWDPSSAILSGDVMLIDAFMRISCAPADCVAEVMNVFSRTAVEVCEGQQYDMEFESVDIVPMDGYNMMIGLKTAVLIACSAKIGALIAGAAPQACEAMYRYGYELGMAFQVADDYLDAYGDEKTFGKPIGGDILNCKKSWLTVRALEKTPDTAGFLAAFNMAAQTPAEKAAKIAAVKDYYDSLGVADDARAEIRRFTARAMEALDGAGLDNSAREAFADFAEKLVGRAR